mmetsp:Transcript_35721/g.50029  ORF Transcript_35721/g.50029 Transcript_35721/m.50029 type:complete len:367 (-) Transcript_35721:346-1446(-)
MRASNDRVEDLRIVAELLDLVGCVHGRPNACHLEVILNHALSNARVNQGSLHPWVGSHEQQGIGLFNPFNRGVEEILAAEVEVECQAILPGEVVASHLVHQVLQQHQGFSISKVSADSDEFLWRCLAHSLLDCSKRIRPRAWLQLSIHLHHRRVEALRLESIVGESSLVRDPFLIHGFVEARDDSHHLVIARIHPDGGAHGVRNINGFGALQLPGPRSESVRLRRERANRAKIDDVSRHLRIKEGVLDVSADLHSVTASRSAKHWRTCHLGGEPDASRAVDATSHDSLHKRADVFVLYTTFGKEEAGTVATESHGLILEVTLATLVANRAIKGVIRKEKLHDSLTSLVHQWRVGLDFHTRHKRHRT